MTARRRMVMTLVVLFAAASAAPPPAARAEDPAGAAVDASQIAGLKKELEDTYLQVQRDFDLLSGSGAAEVLSGLEAAVAEEAKSRAGVAVPTEEFAALWERRKLLGPVVSGRLAARLPEARTKVAEEKAGEASTLGDALRVAAKLVFPEATMADNWDRHFMDLDVVRRWTKAKGAAPPTPDAPRGDAPRPADATDPADMVAIPKGDLSVPEGRGRGWPNNGQKAEKHAVKPFYIDRTEVTGAAYAAFLRDLKDGKLRERLLPLGWKMDEKGVVTLPEGAGNLPVAGIYYEGAKRFAESLGKRLPTEDEWERAARGPSGLRFPWGADFVDGSAVVGGKAGPAAAGSTAGDRSGFGAMDMAGNVSELCATLADGKPVGKALPPATEQVVIRGGSFKDPPEEAANDWRYVTGPSARSDKVGFRCAMDEKEYERKYGKK